MESLYVLKWGSNSWKFEAFGDSLLLTIPDDTMYNQMRIEVALGSCA